jgi:IS30 family transposase
LKRNCDRRNGNYRASLAQRRCEKRHFDKNKKVSFTPKVKEHITIWIKEDYSPEQLVGIAKTQGIVCVSIERIYQFI